MPFEAQCMQAGFIKATRIIVREKWKPATEVFEFIR